MAYTVRADIVMAYIVMAYVDMAYIVMALYSYGLCSHGLYSYGLPARSHYRLAWARAGRPPVRLQRTVRRAP